MATRPARVGFYAKFEREVDSDGKLTPQERAKRVDWAMKSHMQRMALKSAKARSASNEHLDTPVTGMETRLTPAAP